MRRPHMTPAVSVILPTYNRAHLLPRSIASVLGQTFTDFELIVVDDCSTDGTERLVQEIPDQRLRYIRLDRNSGSPAAPTNAGIRVSQGRFIAVQDSDDEWLPQKLGRQMDAIGRNTGAGVVYTDMWRIDEKGCKSYWPAPVLPGRREDLYRDALAYKIAYIGTVTLLIKRELLDDAGCFDERLRMLIDTDLLIRLARVTTFCHIAEPLVNYWHTPSSIVSNLEAAIEARKLILEKYFDDIALHKRALAQHYHYIGSSLLAGGQAPEARRYLAKAIHANPLNRGGLVLYLLSLFGVGTSRLAFKGYMGMKRMLGRDRHL